MRRFASALLVVAAVGCLLVGVALAAVFGTDDRARTGPHQVGGSAAVLTSAPDLLRVAGPVVQVTAQLPDDRPVFLGVGNAVDVASYTHQVALTSIDAVSVRPSRSHPLRLGLSRVGGAARLPAPPSDIDWWLASSSGQGQAVLLVELPTDPASLVVAALDDEPLDDLVLTASYLLPGAFGIGLGLVGLGLGLAIFAWLTRPSPRDGSRSQAAGQQPAVAAGPAVGESRGRVHRSVPIGLALLLTAGLSGCELPRGVTGEPSKLAATPTEATEVVNRWAEQRAEALRLLEAAPLSDVEATPTLDIDQGAFEVARRLFAGAAQRVRQDLRLETVQSPRLGRYPLWFVATVADGEQEVTKLQVHRRDSAATPWQLVAQADVLAQTELPELAVDGSGAIEPVAADTGEGLAATPQEVADAYAGVLDDGSAAGDDLVAVDSFVQQTRTVVSTLESIDGVELEQSWSAGAVQWAMRTSDGGALAFITMTRTDAYRLESPRDVEWPAESEQQALLANGSDETPTLEYLQQVLLYLPPAGAGQASALGQYGGVVSDPAG